MTANMVEDESDLRIIAHIIEAAIWYTMAEKVDLKLPESEGEVSLP